MVIIIDIIIIINLCETPGGDDLQHNNWTCLF